MKDILIVDDDLITSAHLEEIITSKGHHVAGRVNSGQKAVDSVKTLNPDLVLMDIKMPGELDGLAAGKIIKERFSVPVIFITAYSSEQVIKQVSTQGAYGYIIKPFDESQVESAVNIALYRSETEKQLNKLVKKYQKQVNNQISIMYLINKINTTLDPVDNLNEFLIFVRNITNLDGIILYNYTIDAKAEILIGRIVAECLSEKATRFSYTLDNEYKIPLTQVVLDRINLFKKLNIFNHLNKPPGIVGLYYEKMQIQNMLSVPLIIDKQFYGVINYFFCEKKSFGVNFKNFLKIISEMIAIIYKRHDDLVKIQDMEKEKSVQEKMILRMERLTSFGQLTTAIAHEIRQPLQSIKVLTDSVLFWDKENKKMSYEELLQHFEKISARVSRIEKIIQNMQLLMHSPEKIEVKAIDINQCIHDTLEIIQEKCKQHDVGCELKLHEDLDSVLFSDVQLQQVIINLINNSIHALDTKQQEVKTITISTGQSSKTIWLKFEDNGPGIPAENREKIFNPFFSTYQTSGTMGMGLYIITNILKSFNASIEVSESEYGGACFLIRFNKQGH